jgi:hypothetical protein
MMEHDFQVTPRRESREKYVLYLLALEGFSDEDTEAFMDAKREDGKSVREQIYTGEMLRAVRYVEQFLSQEASEEDLAELSVESTELVSVE